MDNNNIKDNNYYNNYSINDIIFLECQIFKLGMIIIIIIII